MPSSKSVRLCAKAEALRSGSDLVLKSMEVRSGRSQVVDKVPDFSFAGEIRCPAEEEAKPGARVALGIRFQNDVDQPKLRGRLAGTIEGQIIPRLLLAHRASREAPMERILPTDEEIADFAYSAIKLSLPALRTRVDAYVGSGMLLSDVFLNLLSPAARLLGEWWLQDIIEFTEVTIGLTQLQQLVRELTPAFSADRENVAQGGRGRRALLLPVPGEQHTFGLILVGEFFRRSGWYVDTVADSSEDAVLEAVRERPFDVVGFSLSSESHFDRTRSIIGKLRQTSVNAMIQVMVGGQAIAGRTDICRALDADASPLDGRHAAVEASKLLDTLSHRC